MKTEFSFDPKCFDLAEHFLPEGTPRQVKDELAQAIQNAVEEYICPKEEIPGDVWRGAAMPFADNH